MNKISSISLGLLCGISVTFAAATVNISGTVTKTGGGPLKGVKITLASVSGITAITDSLGKFNLSTVRAIRVDAPDIAPYEFAVKNNKLVFSTSGKLTGEIAVFTGNGKLISNIIFSDLNPATQSISLPELAPGLNIMRLTLNNTASSCQVLRVGNELYLQQNVSGNRNSGAFQLTKSAAAVKDTLIATKAQFSDKKVFITSYDTTVAIQMDTLGGNNCTVPTLPSFAEFKEIKELPDPFLMMNGTRMTKKVQWACRREEIKALAQKCIYGWMPPKPDKMEATYSGEKLTIKCTVGSVTKEFAVTISGNTGTGPFPAIITVAGAVYGVPNGVATINYSSHTTVAQTTVMGRGTAKGKGIFYELYPDYKPTGSLAAWAWGVGCIIDALEREDIKSQAKINPTKIGVTGCSYAGKAAFAIAILEERIALSLPVESGAGGVAAWRVAEEFAPKGKPQNGQDGCQYLYETYDESTWLGDSINMFRNKEYTIPIDMHEVAALIAPRALLGLGYSTKWICAQGEWITGVAAQKVYAALGYPNNIGMLIGQAGSHCAKTSGLNEQTVYNNFVKKFLQGDSTINTSASVALRKDNGVSIDEAKYIPWTVPTLE